MTKTTSTVQTLSSRRTASSTPVDRQHGSNLGHENTNDAVLLHHQSCNKWTHLHHHQPLPQNRAKLTLFSTNMPPVQQYQCLQLTNPPDPHLPYPNILPRTSGVVTRNLTHETRNLQFSKPTTPPFPHIPSTSLQDKPTIPIPRRESHTCSYHGPPRHTLPRSAAQHLFRTTYPPSFEDLCPQRRAAALSGPPSTVEVSTTSYYTAAQHQ